MTFQRYQVSHVKPGFDVGMGASLVMQADRKAHLRFFLTRACAAELGWADNALLEILLGAGDDHGLVRLRPSATGTARVLYRNSGRNGKFVHVGLGHVAAFVNRAERKQFCAYEPIEDG